MNLRLWAGRLPNKRLRSEAVTFPQACLTTERSWFSAKKYVFELKMASLCKDNDYFLFSGVHEQYSLF